ncbi:hypothetical protein HNQ65_003237 [Prosthecobacter vanneervenii]|uniref:Uncharacterized protein n=1 Tax=Prosthecobacter vanneervenii TaxID=48466 RepID=A0A7W8DKV1_9BACT|nr:hypothetical protein [Prosthecobacter vanneervenii]
MLRRESDWLHPTVCSEHGGLDRRHFIGSYGSVLSFESSCPSYARASRTEDCADHYGDALGLHAVWVLLAA